MCLNKAKCNVNMEFLNFILTEKRCEEFVKKQCHYNNASCIVCNLSQASPSCTSAGCSVFTSSAVHALILGLLVLLLPRRL